MSIETLLIIVGWFIVIIMLFLIAIGIYPLFNEGDLIFWKPVKGIPRPESSKTVTKKEAQPGKSEPLSDKEAPRENANPAPAPEPKAAP